MNRAPHLLPRDRPEFERVLDEALRTANRRPELAAIGRRLTVDQLRKAALAASSAISGCAASEYEHYLRVRDEQGGDGGGGGNGGRDGGGDGG
ncbi:hypothetical protein ACSNOD_31195, partial [Streptomyces sp. URMC 123]